MTRRGIPKITFISEPKKIEGREAIPRIIPTHNRSGNNLVHHHADLPIISHGPLCLFVRFPVKQLPHLFVGFGNAKIERTKPMSPFQYA
jgi:hypothetical protein